MKDEANNYPRMSGLAETFPTLRGRPGVRPFDAHAMAAGFGTASSGERAAMAFVLTVFNPKEWGHDGLARYAFDLHAAMGCWDDEHRAAFIAWARDPWYP